MVRLAVLFLLVSLTTLCAQDLPANVEKIDALGNITQYRLKSNGMTILLSENHAAPVITFMVVYHVGSRNEAPGNTGSAHLLEHMIFNKSTESFGKAKGHKTFQEVLYEAGCDYSSTNMTTWYDRMNGYSTLPSDKLELAMKIEADRMSRALILDEERQPEMSVVRNEYEIGENDPSGALDKLVTATAITAHPYHWSTIGYRSDIEGVTTDKLREHYKAFFWPDNSEAVLVGDFKTADALKFFDQSFGAFPKSPGTIPKVITQEPPQEGERRVTVKRPGGVPLVQMAYPRPGSLHPDFLPLDVLTVILGTGISSRLHQALVERGLATQVSAGNTTLRDPYVLQLEAKVAAGSSHEAVEKALKETLAKVAADGVTDEELARAQRQIEVDLARSRDGTYRFAAALGEAVASANWKWFVNYLPNAKAVTKADVQRVARTYLVPDHATVGWYVPQAEGSGPPRAERDPSASASAASTAPVAAPSVAAEAPAPEPGGKTFAERTVRKVLANGLTVSVVENHAVPTVSVRGVMLAGTSSAPAGKPALPQLTAMMVQRGTTSRDKAKINQLLDGNGMSIWYETDVVEARVNGSALSRDLPLLLDIMGDQLSHPTFPEDELVKAKAEMRSDVLMSADRTEDRAMIRLSQAAFPEGHPFHRASPDAVLKSLDTATSAEVKAFHTERHAGSAMWLAVVGDVKPDEVFALVEKHFGALPKGTPPATPDARTAPVAAQREPITMRGKANMTFLFGNASGLRIKDPDYEAALVANAALAQNALTSRVGKRVRDTEGLSYNLYSRFYYTDVVDGMWALQVNVAPQNLARALKSSREEVDRFASGGVTEEEVRVQKSFFSGNYVVKLGTNAGVAAALAAAERFGFGPAYLDEFPRRVSAVTLDQVNAAIKSRFHPDKMHLFVAGDLDKLPE